MKSRPSKANLPPELLKVAQEAGEEAAYEILNRTIDVINRRFDASVALLLSDNGYGQKRVSRTLAQLHEIYEGYDDIGHIPRLHDQQTLLDAQIAELESRGIKI